MVTRRSLFGLAERSFPQPTGVSKNSASAPASHQRIVPRELEDLYRVLRFAKQQRKILSDAALSAYIEPDTIDWWVDFTPYFHQIEFFPEQKLMVLQPGVTMAKVQAALRQHQGYCPLLQPFITQQPEATLSQVLFAYTDFDEAALSSICGVEILSSEARLEWLTYFDSAASLQLQSPSMRHRISQVFEWQWELEQQKAYADVLYYFPGWTKTNSIVQRPQLARMVLGSMASLFLIYKVYLQVLPLEAQISTPQLPRLQSSSQFQHPMTQQCKQLWDPEHIFYSPRVF